MGSERMIAAYVRIVRALAIGWLALICVGCGERKPSNAAEQFHGYVGKLVDKSGRPIEGARAGYWAVTIGDEGMEPSLADWKSNSAGEFQIGIDRFNEPNVDDTTRKPPMICFVHEKFVDLVMRPNWPNARNPVVNLGTLVFSRGARVVGTLEPLHRDPERTFEAFVSRPDGGDCKGLVDVAEDGRFRIRGLGAGAYEVGAQARGGFRIEYEVSVGGRVIPNKTIELAEGEDAQVQIRIVGERALEPSFTESFMPRHQFSGRIIDGSGRPMAGVNVAAFTLEGFVSVRTTDEDGKVLLWGPSEDKEFDVAVIHRSMVLARTRIPVNGPRSFELRVSGEPTLPAVVIRLRDAVTGAPIRNATIRSAVFPICGNDSQGTEIFSARRPEAREVEPGLYRAPFIPFGFRTFALGIRADGYGSAHTEPVELSQCQDYGPIDIAMTPAEHVRVRVVNSVTGKALVGSVVALDEGPDDCWNLDSILGRVKTTDANGVVRFDDVPAGTYRVSIDRDPSLEFFFEEVVVEPGKTKGIEATIKAYAKLRIVVLDSQGKPVEPGWSDITRNGVSIEGSAGYHPSAWIVFRSFDVGPCKVTLRGGGLGEQVLSAEGELRSGEETSVMLKAKP
jgi:hypothetical protein